MSHIHNVIDIDVPYKIDVVLRTVTNISEVKRELVQYDHKSERLTFEMPRYFDGHDFTKCNVVEVHFDNVSTNGVDKSSSYYTVKDLHVKEDDENIVVFSWLVEGDATKYVGTLNFAIHFACIVDDVIDYVWGTTEFKGIVILPGLLNSKKVIEHNPNILQEIELRLNELELKGAVLYTDQNLTKEEQQQARKNIGALSATAIIKDGVLVVGLTTIKNDALIIR